MDEQKGIHSEYQAIDKQIAELSVQKALSLEEAMKSNDPQELIKAAQYLKSQSDKSQPTVKSWLLTPPDVAPSQHGYRPESRIGGLDFFVLRKLSGTVPVSQVVGTRIDQVSNFLNFTLDEQREGYTIRKKLDLFADRKEARSLTREDKNAVTDIVHFLESGGSKSKWGNADDLYTFSRKMVNDSLIYDQATTELVRDRSFKLTKYIPVDASFIRFLDFNDPRNYSAYKDLIVNLDGEEFFPKYGMVYNNQLMVNPTTGHQIVYYPWELAYGVRNQTTSVWRNGYGVPELEIAASLVTGILYGFDYNVNLFKNGSNPRGFINIKSGGGNVTVINSFRDAWRQMMTGNVNSHKIPVFEGIDLEWIDLQKANREMEFQKWMDFLLLIFCSVYRIDPSELGMNLNGGSNMFGQDGQKARLEHSKTKGLKPLLVFLEKYINKYIVSEFNPRFEFKFTGIDIEDEAAQVDLDDKKLKAGLVSFETMFEKYNGRKYDPKKDTILNQVFQTAKQAGGQQMNEFVDDQSGSDTADGNPFASFMNKGMEDNPIASAAFDVIESILGVE